ncbi:MAG: DUF255 domain-containing protein [Bacteroidetes bacterium]|nr:MAG: DUF255 domain-containing protein [Bacteroidota bacterium]
MDNLYIKSTLPLLIIVILLLSLFGTNSDIFGSDSPQQIRWVSLEQALDISQKERKPIWLDVQTAFCVSCKDMDKNVYQNKEVISLVNEYYCAVKIDADSKEKITFQGKKLTQSEFVKEVLKVNVYPSHVYFFNEKVHETVPFYQSTTDLQKYLQHYISKNSEM